MHTAYCVCPAGCCNHVATLLHAFEEFLLLGLREESKVPCTSHLQQYKQPRCRNVPLCGCSNNKRRYGKQKHRKLVQPLYEPHPLNICLPKTENAAERTRNSDNWQCGKYGSSCLLKLMEHSSSESNSCTSDDADDDDDDDDDSDTCVRVIFRS